MEKKDIKDAIKTTNSKLLQRNSVGVLDYKDINPEENEENAFDDDVVSPSVLEEKLYGQLEDQEAKMAGFQFAKDSSGKDIYFGPIVQVNDNKNDSIVKPRDEHKTNNATVPQKSVPLEKEEKSKNVSSEVEKVLNDPLAKVSYLLNQEANSHNLSHNFPDKETTQTNDGASFTTQKSKAIQIKTTATNASYVPDSFRKVGGKMPLINTMSNNLESNTNSSKSDQKGMSSEGGVANSVQEPVNIQLPELVESVIEHLGDHGSKFVSVQLAKHPAVKNVWASLIAEALIKQSDHISQLDSKTNSTESSKIASVEPDLIGMKGNKTADNLLKNKHNAKPKTKPITEMSFNQMIEPTRATEMVNKNLTVPVHATSQVEDHLNSNTSAPTFHSIHKETNQNPQGNESAKLGAQSQTGKVPINQAAHTDNVAKVTSQYLQNNTGVKPSTQVETARKPISQENLKGSGNDISNDANQSRPLFVSKNIDSLGGNHQIKVSKQQLFGSKQIVTPLVNGFVSSNENINDLKESLDKDKKIGGESITTNIDDVKLTGEQSLRDKPILAHNEFSSSEKMESPFLLNNITKLDPGEKNYLQINLMSDPVGKEGFSDSESPDISQQQLQEEDDKEAKYLEHQINDAGEIVKEIMPSLNTTLSKADSGEANYVSGQLQDNPFSTAEVSESFGHNNDLVNAENMQNVQFLSSVLKEDSNLAAIANQQWNSQHHQRPDPTKPHTVTEKVSNMGAISTSRSSPYSNHLNYRDGTNMADEPEDHMILNPNTISDISAVDLAPMSSLEGFDGSYNINKPKSSFMYEMQSERNEQAELMNGANEASFMRQYAVTPLEASVVQAQKKRQIRRVKHLKVNKDKSSSTSVAPVTQPRFQHIKTLSKQIALAIKPTKPRSQPGIRESEISPTSVIFGLTTNEMKELEKHLAHGPHTLEDKKESSSLRGMLSEGKQYYDMKTEKEQEEHTRSSLRNSTDNILQQKKSKTKGRKPGKHQVPHQRKRVKQSLAPSHGLPSIRENKKAKHSKRDLESLEAHTEVLSSDVDEIRDLNPNAQAVIVKDYHQQRRNVKGLRPFPFDERDPSHAFERSFKEHTTLKLGREASRRSKNSEIQIHRRMLLDNKKRRRKIVKESSEDGQLGKKSKFPLVGQFNGPKVGEPVITKENKILNGDVIPLYAVNSLDSQGLILKTLRKESEGDIRYLKSVEKHDVNRMKNVFQSVADVIGTTRHALAHRHWPPKENHSEASKFTEKRNLGDSITEFSDGTFRSRDFEKQLSRALMQENEHDLTFVGAVQNVDEDGLKTLLSHKDDPVGSRTISQNGFMTPQQNNKETGPTDSSNNDSIKKSQEHLMLFFQATGRHEDSDNERQDVSAKKAWKTSDVKDSKFHDLTPEGKVLSPDYKELGSLGADTQSQLASVLQFANSGEQRDLKALEKMDSDDEKELDSLFTPVVGKFKRAIEERLAVPKEDKMETVADIQEDPGSKEKNLNIVVNDYIENGKSH